MKVYNILSIIIIVLILNSLLFSDEVTTCIEINNNPAYRLNQNNNSIPLTSSISPLKADVDVLVIYVTFPNVPGGLAPGGDALPGFDANIATTINNYFVEMSNDIHHVHLRTAGGKMFTADYPADHYIECFAGDGCAWSNSGMLAELVTEIFQDVYDDDNTAFTNSFDPTKRADMVFLNSTGNIFKHHSAVSTLSNHTSPYYNGPGTTQEFWDEQSLEWSEAHEYGHQIGLNHPPDNDIRKYYGRYELMYNQGPGDGVNPISIRNLMKLGWISCQTLDYNAINTPIEIKDVRTNYTCYKLPLINVTNNNQYLLFANHQGTGFDDEYPATGLLVWHIKEPSQICDIESASGKWIGATPAPINGTDILDDNSFANYKGGAENFFQGYMSGGKYASITPATNPSSNCYSGYTRTSPENINSHKAILNIRRIPSSSILVNIVQNYWSDTVFSADALWEENQSPYYISGEIEVEPSVELTIEDDTEVLFDADAELIINGTLNTSDVTFSGAESADGANITFNSPLSQVNGTMTISNGSTIVFNDDCTIASSATLKIGANSTVIFNGDDNTIIGSLELEPSSVVQLGSNKGLTINGQLTAGNYTVSGTNNAWIVFNSAINGGNGYYAKFTGDLLPVFNEDISLSGNAKLEFLNTTRPSFEGKITFYEGSRGVFSTTGSVNFGGEFQSFTENLVFGPNSIVVFDDTTRFYSGSETIFGNNSTITFKKICTLFGNQTFGSHNHVKFYGVTGYSPTSVTNFGSYSTVDYYDLSIKKGSLDYGNGSIVTYHHDTINDPELALCNYGNETTINIKKKYTIKSGATVKFNHVTANIKDSLNVRGKLWVDNSILDCGDDSTKSPGITFEGDDASLSRITDTIIRDGVDGFTITNASPLIKTSEVLNIEKRGFNIIGIDAEPEIRQCYIHLTGTYPLQMLSEADPTLVDNRFYGNGKCGARIWGADGTFSRNEFRSNDESGVFVFSSSAQPQFYSFADSGGNMFDMSHIATQAIFIGGGNPMFGDYPNINGNNIFKNRGSRYYIYNDTPGDIDAQLSWWANGTPPNAFYNSDGGSVVFLPKLSSEPPAGPLLLKAAASPSPFNAGFEKYRQKDYAGAM